MNTLSRFFDSMTTMFFILWMFLNLFEKSALSVVCMAAVLFFGFCLLIVRAFISYRIARYQLKQ